MYERDLTIGVLFAVCITGESAILGDTGHTLLSDVNSLLRASFLGVSFFSLTCTINTGVIIQTELSDVVLTDQILSLFLNLINSGF